MFPYIDLHTHTSSPGSSSGSSDALGGGRISVESVRLCSAATALPTSGLFTAGVHPWDARQAREDWLEILAARPRGLIAVGEVGLDLRAPYRAYAPQQTMWFERQIEVANRLDKPLIIHCVRATPQVMQLLQRAARVAAVLHGFTGSTATLQQWLERKPREPSAAVRFSFGPLGLRSPKAREALQFLSEAHPDRLFFETDADQSVDICRVYELAARATGQSVEGLAQRVYRNFQTLFPDLIP